MSNWRVNVDGDEWQAMLPEVFRPGEQPGTSKITCESAEVIGPFVVLVKTGVSIYVPTHKVFNMFSYEGKPPAGFAPAS